MTDSADTGKVLGLLGFERTVSSLPKAIAFYRDALGFTLVDPAIGPWSAPNATHPVRSVQAAHLRLGEQDVHLTEFDPPGDPYPADSTSADLWFQHFAIVTTNMAAAYARLQRYDHQAISRNGPEHLPPSSGNVTAYKFRDPDGHPLELIAFPSGTGDARWHEDKGLLNLGIDHSAISVSDDDSSIAFYCEGLGLTVASRQTNQGVGQDDLDDLPHDRVDVIALSPSQAVTPHIELLAYYDPVGRASSTPSRPWHSACDRLVLRVSNLEAIGERLTRTIDGQCVVERTRGSAMVRDPDGHLLVLTERTGPIEDR